MNRPLPLRRRGAALDLDETLAELTAAFAETAAEHDRCSSFPFENFTRLHERDLLALTAPAALGGGGADLATALRVIEAVARGEPHLVTENAIAAVEKAIAAAGNPGLSRHNDLQRHYRDVLCGRVHTPQADVALAGAGAAALAAFGA